MSTKIKDRDKHLTIRDLIITGVFAALLMIANGLGGAAFAINPALTFFYPIGGAVFGGPVFLLLLAKLHKRGALVITGVVFCILGLVTGMHWGMDFGALIALVIADFIAASGKYGDMKRNILAYMIYCIGPAGTYFVFYIDPQGWAKTMLKNGTTQDYIDTMSKAANASTLVIMVLGTFAVAALSGFIGSRLMKKQFEKSGVTA